MKFIIWDPKDGNPRRESGEFISGGLLGEITSDSVYLTAYPTWPKEFFQRPGRSVRERLASLQVGECVRNVSYSLSATKGTYEVWRVS